MLSHVKLKLFAKDQWLPALIPRHEYLKDAWVGYKINFVRIWRVYQAGEFKDGSDCELNS